MTSQFIENPDPQDISCRQLRDFLSIWHRLKAEVGLPARRHFTFQLLKMHLPNIVIVDYLADTKRFRVSLTGTNYTEMLGQEVKGWYVDELTGIGELLERCRHLVKTKTPYLAVDNSLEWIGRGYKYYTTVALPLFDEAGSVNKILFCLSFDDAYGNV
ncbi:MAG: PAS domain-containing protein [Kordiimonadaceae bacterium]|nr:PAS domain-containing protein [Kordiimonadaceae bacterium]